MRNVFIVETVVERTQEEFYNSRDTAIQLHLLTAVDSFNFHWLELRLQKETIRLEALRSNPKPNTKHQWGWPESYRLLVYRGWQKQTDHIISRGERGEGLFSIELAGMKLPILDPLRLMRRKDFVSLSYCVGRLTKKLSPKRLEPQ